MLQLNQTPTTESRIKASLEAYEEAIPFRYTDKPRYIERLNKFYSEEIYRRTEQYKRVSGSSILMKNTLLHVSRRENIIDWMVDSCWTYDPRLSAIGLPTTLPWIPWPQQIEFIEWAYDKYLNQRRSLVEKSRDQGATWLFCLIQLFEWRWTDGFAGGFGSATLTKVDNRDDPDAIFEKLRALLRHLPKWWLPSDFDWAKHDKKGNLWNPNMKSSIVGQGGKQIGRGGRRSMYVVDEAAALETPMNADSALSQNTDCQFDLSTPAGMNHFGKKRHGKKLPVFTFHWKNDPRKNKEWYEVQVNDLDPVVVAQEIDINYQASVSGLFILPKWVDAAVDIQLEPVGDASAGLDVAAGGSNKSALAIKYGPVVTVEAFAIDNGIYLTHSCIELCNKAGVGYLNYDEIGVGYAVHSALDATEMKMEFLHYGLNAGNSPSDEYYPEFKKKGKEIFFNARSEWWYITARKFERTWEHMNKIRVHKPEDMISIDNEGDLKIQLSSPLKMYTETGKIKCESKEFMLKRGIDSPDEADALVMACLKKAGGAKHVMGDMDFLGSTDDEAPIDWDKPAYNNKHYGAVAAGLDLTFNSMYGVWDEEKEHLYIYGEYKSDFPDPIELVDETISQMQIGKIRVDKILGNSLMFSESKRTIQKEINKAFRSKCGGFQNIKMKEASKYDPMGSISTLMYLMKEKKITIHPNCKEIKSQFYTWKLNQEKLDHTGMRECILMIISELAIYQPYEKIRLKKPKYSNVIPDPRGDGSPINNPMEV